MQTVEDAYGAAFDNAAFEAFEGKYSESELAGIIDKSAIRAEALKLILDGRKKTDAERNIPAESWL